MSAGISGKIGVIGCGYWGKNLIRNFHDLGALGAVCDESPDAANQYAGQYGVPAMDVDTVLSTPDLAGIVISTPAETHADLAMRALDAGKHVFVEKPLALTVEEAERVLAKAEATGRVLMVGHLLQYHAAFLRLKGMVAGGELGRVQYLYSNRLNLGKVRREENILWSFAPHDISMILSLAGAEPEGVWASGGNYLNDAIADVTTTHLSFPGGVKGHVFVSWLHPYKEQKLVVVGDKGMAVFNDGEPWESKLLFYPHVIAWEGDIPTPTQAEAIPVKLDESEPLRDECQHFMDCMEKDMTPRTDGAEAVRVLRVLAAAQQCLRG